MRRECLIVIVCLLACHRIGAHSVDSFLSGFCKGIVVGEEDDGIVGRVSKSPVVSLEGQGSHRLLKYRFTLSHETAEDVAIVHSLPTVWFVDPFDERRVVGKNSTDCRSQIVGDWVDLESIEIFADPITHVLVWDKAEGGVIDVGVKVHARYGSVPRHHHEMRFWEDPYAWLLSDWKIVRFHPFEVVLRGRSGQCTRVRPVQEPLLAGMVTGAARHEVLVIPMTAASLILGVLCCIMFSTSRIIIINRN